MNEIGMNGNSRQRTTINNNKHNKFNLIITRIER